MPFAHTDATTDELGSATPQTSSRRGESEPLLSKTGATGEAYAEALRSSGTLSTGKEALARVPAAARRRAVSRERYAAKVQLALKTCVSAIDAALESRDSIIEKSNAINDVKDALARLWHARHNREEQFGDLVNHLQGVLMGVDSEEMPFEHIEALGQVVRRASNVPVLTDSDLREFEKLLVSAGCDVFRELR